MQNASRVTSQARRRCARACSLLHSARGRRRLRSGSRPRSAAGDAAAEDACGQDAAVRGSPFAAPCRPPAHAACCSGSGALPAGCVCRAPRAGARAACRGSQQKGRELSRRGGASLARHLLAASGGLYLGRARHTSAQRVLQSCGHINSQWARLRHSSPTSPLQCPAITARRRAAGVPHALCMHEGAWRARGCGTALTGLGTGRPARLGGQHDIARARRGGAGAAAGGAGAEPAVQRVALRVHLPPPRVELDLPRGGRARSLFAVF